MVWSELSCLISLLCSKANNGVSLEQLNSYKLLTYYREVRNSYSSLRQKSEETILVGCDITHAYIVYLIFFRQYDSCSSSFISYEVCICREIESIPLAIQICFAPGSGHAVAQLVEALRNKSEVRGFDSPWCHWNFSLK